MAIKKIRIIIFIITLISAATVISLYYYISKKNQIHADDVIAASIQIDGTVLPKVRVIHPFHLIDNEGHVFTKNNLKNHWTLMFFGFTNCGYVCPTTLSALKKMYDDFKKILPPNSLPQVVMVSVDPERDTVARLDEYVKSFNPIFRGLRGNLTEITAIANQMSVVFGKVQMPNGDYTITHSAEIMLLDPTGNLRAFFSYPHQAEQMVHDYETIIHAYPFKFLAQEKKWTLINYWATWCHPCMGEIPELNSFYSQHKNQVIVLGVNYDQLQGPSLNQAIRQFKIQFPVLTQDPRKPLHLPETGVVPTTYLLDPQEKLVQVLVGPQTERSLNKIISKHIR